MPTPLYFAHVLAAALLLGTALPCELIEAAVASRCSAPCLEATATGASADRSADSPSADASNEPADELHFDCCMACLTCCARYTTLATPGSPVVWREGTGSWFPTNEAINGPPGSIWRPPRG